jgi:hypothetical protein
MGGGTTGVIKTIEGNIMTLSTAQDVTTVNLSESTSVQQTITGALADLEPGMRVRIVGQADESGAISASQIVILDDSQTGQPIFELNPGGSGYPAPAESNPAAPPDVKEP